jgi:peptidoglycan/LPS O-acetylase OafA/YrhL
MSVGGFFVLSGYTIRAVCNRMDGFNARQFLIDRASRLLSVSIIALLLTIVADNISYRIAPGYYLSNFGNSMGEPTLSLLANLFLFSQPYGLNISPLSNSPFWSLSYEAGFYIIWAAYMYWKRSGGSVNWLLAAMICYGPNILFMMPFWILGAWLFDTEKLGARTRGILAASITAMFVIFCALFFGIGQAEIISDGKTIVASCNASINWVFNAMGIGTGKVSLSAMFASVLVFCLLTPVLYVSDRTSKSIPPPRSMLKISASLGNLTFPLYLMHFPLLVLAKSAKLFDPNSTIEKIYLISLLVIAAHVCAKFSDQLKTVLRTRFSALA